MDFVRLPVSPSQATKDAPISLYSHHSSVSPLILLMEPVTFSGGRSKSAALTANGLCIRHIGISRVHLASLVGIKRELRRLRSLENHIWLRAHRKTFSNLTTHNSGLSRQMKRDCRRFVKYSNSFHSFTRDYFCASPCAERRVMKNALVLINGLVNANHTSVCSSGRYNSVHLRVNASCVSFTVVA